MLLSKIISHLLSNSCFIQDTADGTCNVEYFPTAAGDYDVTITYGGEHIIGSPFTVNVADKVDPSKVRKTITILR